MVFLSTCSKDIETNIEDEEGMVEDRRCAPPLENTLSIYRDREKGEVEEVGRRRILYSVYSREGGVE